MVSRLRYSDIAIQNKNKKCKNSKLSGISAFVKNSIKAMALCLPLIQCGPGIHKNIDAPIDQKKVCSVDVQNESVVLTYNGTKTINLDIPEGIILENPKVFCQDNRTIILTPEYAGRSLGANEIDEGNEMLGLLDGNFFYQNTVFLSLSPLGKLDSAEVSGNLLVVTTKEGKSYRIDMDRPGQPAKLMQ